MYFISVFNSNKNVKIMGRGKNLLRCYLQWKTMQLKKNRAISIYADVEKSSILIFSKKQT